jgi:hypothetical protein
VVRIRNQWELGLSMQGSRGLVDLGSSWTIGGWRKRVSGDDDDGGNDDSSGEQATMCDSKARDTRRGQEERADSSEEKGLLLGLKRVEKQDMKEVGGGDFIDFWQSSGWDFE